MNTVTFTELRGDAITPMGEATIPLCRIQAVCMVDAYGLIFAEGITNGLVASKEDAERIRDALRAWHEANQTSTER